MVDTVTLISVLRGVASGTFDPTEILNSSLRELTPERLEYAVSNNLEPTSFFWRELHLSDPTIYNLFRVSLRRYWRDVEPVITSAQKIYAILTTDSDGNGRKKILDTPQGRKFFNDAVKKCYRMLYSVAWS